MSLNRKNWPGTKAETLQFLQTKLKSASVCKMVSFSAKDWTEKQTDLITEIKRCFQPEPVIVRSSAANEDSLISSMAGRYSSVPNIFSSDVEAIKTAVEHVIGSYGKDDELDIQSCQILIQPMVLNVSMSGVIFTQDINTGAPYFVINYDDQSGRTDTITSGMEAPNKTLLILRSATHWVKSARIRKIIEAINEIESVIGLDTLDIEFAVTKEEEVFIFQVRPITTRINWNRGISIEIEDAVKRVTEFIRSKQEPIPCIYGGRSIFTQMSDWNPAEMIGTSPSPLALSLYRYLITDKTWNIARAEMGYSEPSGAPLMVSLWGQPYIDVRLSLNSFLPKGIDPATGSKIINFWLQRLEENQELHDKIEFDIAITAFVLDFDKRASEQLPDDLSKDEQSVFRDALLKLTNNLLSGRIASISDEIKKVELLENKRKLLFSFNYQQSPIILNRLLQDCISLGTLPFSKLARHAFIAKGLLDSLVAVGVLTEKEVESFYQSTPTIASDLVQFAECVRLGSMSYEQFLEKFGHLRPGTYDILSLRYDQRESFISRKFDKCSVEEPGIEFAISNGKKEEIDCLLKMNGLYGDSDNLFTYCREAIKGRELSKFIFTHCISDALEYIAHWGERIGLSRNEVSFLTIEEILNADIEAYGRTLEHDLRRRSQKAAQWHEITKALRFPHLVVEPDDVMIVSLRRCQPNFVTRKQIIAPHVFLNGHNETPGDITGKIVMIESADPGFDWIFSQDIAGLVTKFGGANSHMAIRCAELNIPAAIGCGQQLFDRIIKARGAELNCTREQIKPAWI